MVVTIPANVKHWHGAKAGSWFSHIAIEIPGTDGRTEWCEPVFACSNSSLLKTFISNSFQNFSPSFLLAPEKWMMEAGEYTMKRFAKLYGMEYAGMATDKKEAARLGRDVR